MILNKNQMTAFDIASGGHSLLLLGSAGTGKSHVIKEICKELSKKGKKVQLTCSTGIDDGRHDPTEIASVLKNNAKYDKIVSAIMETDVLIVDECSMISKRTFESIKNVCGIKNPDNIFGGIQVIFSGDFFQLPPVPNKRYGDDGTYCFLSDHFESVFPHVVTLSENVRQNDELFVKVISDIYPGEFSECAYTFMNNVSKPLPEGCDSVKLFSTNLLVDMYNRNSLINSAGDMYEFKATGSGTSAE